MEVKFKDPSLERLEANQKYTAGLVKVFHRRIQFIRASPDERAFYAMKSLHYEKLKDDPDSLYSMHLNDQWHLIMYLKAKEDDTRNLVVIVSICRLPLNS
ncbi:type II toxin-antitoxin system RelE/ParE family toxin [Xylella fastidiosa]|uniref:type II toxin-antitoxin system RelE/ParE family toxin n=1 Tax=Xylella fastidiosa TaxID=2371 RepID=UPI000979EB47|nr:type II toxin-antitoxin system RelE/ParE family toxin [Xylella fastidiosa]MDC6412932.1 type II toxin-antitoxin system RelE/ParE family toxin [Xylella fastidiosa subsp. multiplex]MDD0864331.1 type II toxin-antitoxin system RelE/ParE family toxin [Xylella fastidiosa subsp. multiplex]MDD0866460.1 type II toxin-antitoxin system RelE/ParE family toxin [Xylella fastidiosa subsp. multiplex]MDD0873295.1 type II toxin-antitoxin system RelE/ParE family toxin [Xylella fastidiosa subsp. multiplex]MDD08